MMRVVADLRRWLVRWVVAGMLVAGACALPGAWAQRFPPDPVQQLRLALQAPVLDPSNAEELALRRETVQKRIAAIRSLGDLRRALALDVWKDEDRDIGPIEAPLRGELQRRLTQGLRAILTRGDPTSQLAAVTMISEMSVNIRETATIEQVGKDKVVHANSIPYARSFTDDLIRLLKGNNGALAAAAARALGRINPPAGSAADALGGLLTTGAPAERLAAAEALTGMVRTVASLAKGRSPYGVLAGRDEVLETGTAVVPVAARGVRDPDAAVRRSSIEVIQTTAGALTETVGTPRPAADLPEPRKFSPTEGLKLPAGRDIISADPTTIRPLAQALANAAPIVAGALNDSDVLVRIQAARALQAIGFVRLRMQRRASPAPGGLGALPNPGLADGSVVLVGFADEAPKAKEPEPLSGALAADVLLLAARLKDPDVRVRLAVLDALEVIPDELAPAAPALIRALSDPDRFVRWAAARTLGKAAAVAELDTPPMASRTAVPGLICLLGDADLDVRVLGAMYALQRYGPYASPAVTALAAAVNRGDAESRIGAINTLLAIGFGAAPAVPAIAEALSYTDARVRRVAAEALGKFGPDARSAVPTLQRALYDADDEVRRLAADSLLDIVSIVPPKK
jgi:HEAT repeat protein